MDTTYQTTGKCLCHKHSDEDFEYSEYFNNTQISRQLIISTSEARKILGADVQKLSDEDLEEFIFAATSISQQVLQQTVQNNSNGA